MRIIGREARKAFRKKILLIVVNALLLIAFIVCLAASASIKNTLRSQQAATAWAGQSGERFAQVSAFLPDGASFDENDIRSLRETIDRALIEASIAEDEGRTLYTDAWSAESEVNIVGGRGSSSAQAFSVGGDFFLFHPLYLRDGSYLSRNDLMKDRIVLDEELAWRLFGAIDLAGLEVLINDRPHIIAGVISREDDFASTKAYTGGAGLFMSYESLSELSESSVEIICYEIVLPDPITGFAFNTITDLFPNKNAAIVENSARYTLSSVVGIIGAYGSRSMRNDGIIYPYWENAARYTEDWLALLRLLSLIFIVFPFICGVIYGIKGIRFSLRRSKAAIGKKVEERDEREADNYRQTHSEEAVIPNAEEIIREVLEEKEAETAAEPHN